MHRVVQIRPENSADVSAISSLVERAFATGPKSDGREHLIVLALRKAGALTISLVAEETGQLQGHIAFSPVTVAGCSQRWYGLGPVAVEPSVQRIGIGSTLVRAGIGKLKDMGAAGCVVVGAPGYYGRFGFIHVASLKYPGLSPKHFMAQTFGEPMPSGEVSYHAAFAPPNAE